MKPTTETKQTPIENQLWESADKLRKNIDAAEYKHVVLGLVFLKYISDSFEARREKLLKIEYADAEDPDEYRSENIFWVPPNGRWRYVQSQARQPTIGKILDESMEAIEKENKTLKGILPRVFSRPNIAAATLGELVDLISDTEVGNESGRSDDLSNSMSMVLVPTGKALSAMNVVIKPLLEQMIINFKQTCTLENLRDTLLPKLMGGRVKIFTS